MITNKKELKEFIESERPLYLPGKRSYIIKAFLLKESGFYLWKYIVALRKAEFYKNTNRKLRYFYYKRIMNKLGMFLGISIWPNTVDKGINIWHYGNIVINGNAQIGSNCQLHGDNCIGNKGIDDNEAPIIGNNVDIGVGAQIIGNVYIADNVKIGANAVVVKSCYKKGAVLVGIPAHEIQ